jgi:hypothetical protein
MSEIDYDSTPDHGAYNLDTPAPMMITKTLLMILIKKLPKQMVYTPLIILKILGLMMNTSHHLLIPPDIKMSYSIFHLRINV